MKEKQPKTAIKPRTRPEKMLGVTRRVNTGCGKLYITVNFDQQGICELFTHLGKAGGCACSQLEAISRLISLALRSGVEVKAIIRQLAGVGCPSPAWNNDTLVLSCADAVAKVLDDCLNTKTDIGKVSAGVPMNEECPECGGQIERKEGCFVCSSCGYSKCS